MHKRTHTGEEPTNVDIVINVLLRKDINNRHFSKLKNYISVKHFNLNVFLSGILYCLMKKYLNSYFLSNLSH